MEWLSKFASQTAIIDDSHGGADGAALTYQELDKRVSDFAEALKGERGLLFCLCRFDIATIVAYLGALRANQVVCLLDASLHEDLQHNLMEIYKPNWLADSTQSLQRLSDRYEQRLHDDLSLLLPTSGTTGSPKLVRLSKSNIESNAAAIADYLQLGRHSRAIASLPLHYSYGLSVLNSHLYSGGTIVLTNQSIIRPQFWQTFDRHQCTSFAGVPYSYQILERIGFDKMPLPTLNTMTQAGGKLNDVLINKYHQLMQRRGGRFFVMYGQTEATARIAYLDPKFLPKKIGSVGRAIANGKLWIEGNGEVVYSGPNVMLGYAHERADLAKGDELQGILKTGDIGYLDDDGLLYLTGRSHRIAKVFGLRVNLQEIEATLHDLGNVAAIGVSEKEDKIFIFTDNGDSALFAIKAQQLAELYKIHHLAFEFRLLQEIPLTAAGKIDYQSLASQVK